MSLRRPVTYSSSSSQTPKSPAETHKDTVKEIDSVGGTKTGLTGPQEGLVEADIFPGHRIHATSEPRSENLGVEFGFVPIPLITPTIAMKRIRIQ